MDIIWTATLAWIGWNIVGPLLIAAAALVIYAVCCIPGAIRRARCQHLRFFENRACHAICRDCRKDLGFIDDARAALRAREG